MKIKDDENLTNQNTVPQPDDKQLTTFTWRTLLTLNRN